MSRSGYADERSRAVVKQVNALGAHIDLLTADVTVAADVEKAFQQTVVPVAGIIQGAMVLRVSSCLSLLETKLWPLTGDLRYLVGSPIRFHDR
jgi:KR domain.